MKRGNKTLRKSIAVLVGALFLGATVTAVAPAQAASTLPAGEGFFTVKCNASGKFELLSISPTDGNVEVVSTANPLDCFVDSGSPVSPFGNGAYNTVDGLSYFVSYAVGWTQKIYSVNTKTGQMAEVITVDTSGNLKRIDSLAIDTSGTFYVSAVNTSWNYFPGTLDLTTGSVTAIGNEVDSVLSGSNTETSTLAYNPKTSALIYYKNGGVTQVNKSAGTVSDIAVPLTGAINWVTGLAADSNGNVWILDSGTSSSLMTVDVAAKTATKVGDMKLGGTGFYTEDFWIAPVTVPEAPTTPTTPTETATPTPVAKETLAATGSNSEMVLITGLGLLAAGATVMVLKRNRRNS